MSSMGKILFFDANGLIIKSLYYYSFAGRRLQIRNFLRDNQVLFYHISPNVYVKIHKNTKMGTKNGDEPIVRPGAKYTNLPVYNYR